MRWNNAAEVTNNAGNNAAEVTNNAGNNAAENNADGTNNAVTAATEEIAEAEKDEVVTAEASPQNMTAAHVKELKQARELSKTVALALQHKVEAEREAMKLEALAADLRANETALMNRASFAAQSAAMKAARIAAKAILKMHLVEEAKAEEAAKQAAALRAQAKGELAKATHASQITAKAMKAINDAYNATMGGLQQALHQGLNESNAPPAGSNSLLQQALKHLSNRR